MEGVATANKAIQGNTNSPDFQAATQKQDKSAVQGITSTCGTYSVDMSNGGSSGMMTHPGCAIIVSDVEGEGREMQWSDRYRISRWDEQKVRSNNSTNRHGNTNPHTNTHVRDQQLRRCNSPQQLQRCILD